MLWDAIGHVCFDLQGHAHICPHQTGEVGHHLGGYLPRIPPYQGAEKEFCELGCQGDGAEVGMRGRHEEQEVTLAHVDIEGRVPKDHPLRTMKTVADEGL